MVKAKYEYTAARIAALTGALSLFLCFILAALVPSITAADALNPLTERTLLLTSSSPGWAYTDGAGDPNFAPAGSGANGQKTGETFTFDTSTNSTDSGAGATNTPVVAFTFQYCTSAAGYCESPGDDWNETDPGSPPYTDDATHSDLNVAGTWGQGTSGGDFQIYTGVYDSGTGVTTWTATTTTWTMSASNSEDTANVAHPSGANNLITLKSTDGGISPTATEPIKVQFFPSDASYITNPGSGAFFVKINDYSSTKYQNWNDNEPVTPVTVVGTPDTYTCGTDTGLADDDCPADVVDGGVTVANVMNQSIEIQTKVLETMDFSVGTLDPDTVSDGGNHGQCDPIQPWSGSATGTIPAPDTLLLGDPSAEYSLSPTVAYGTSSLWRLSTNSANGATVYYTGNTLADTEGNEIAPMSDSSDGGSTAPALPGSEQFGLGLNYTTETDPNVPGATGSSLVVPYDSSLAADFLTQITNEYSPTKQQNADYWYTPTLSPLAPESSYGAAVGAPDGAFSPSQVSGGDGTIPQFAFNENANTVPVPIASEDTTVVDCSTGQVNYVADIAPSTPADTYTTKINYLAAPEY